MNHVTNSRPRKSLANQLDRLDRILDGMAEALNEAVAAAVTTSVKELLSNPEVLRRIQEVNSGTASSPPKQSIMRRIGKAMRAYWSAAWGTTRHGYNQAKAAGKAGYIRAKAMAKNMNEFITTKVRAVVNYSRLLIPALLLLGYKAKRWISKHLWAGLAAAGAGAGVAVCRWSARPLIAVRKVCHSRKRSVRVLAEWLRRVRCLVAPQLQVAEPAYA